ncbi:MAG: hypothetical protein JWM57_1102 [Phycisphaerales bacterium]|nr:hypothetical protein [Phycisphaerales bacterium]
MKLYLYGAVILAALLMAGLWIGNDFFDAKAGARQSASDLNSCQVIERRIESLNTVSRSTASGTLDQATLQWRAESALQSIGVSPSHLMQVAPEQPRTIGETAYREVSTNLILRDMTLRQTVGLLLAMANDSSPLQTRVLRLSSPHGSAEVVSGDVAWTVEATVVYFIYQPKTAASFLTAVGRDETR